MIILIMFDKVKELRLTVSAHKGTPKKATGLTPVHAYDI